MSSFERAYPKESKADIQERFLKPQLITARTDKWLTCILKPLHSKRKKNRHKEKIFNRNEESIASYTHMRGLIFRKCK